MINSIVQEHSYDIKIILKSGFWHEHTKVLSHHSMLYRKSLHNITKCVNQLNTCLYITPRCNIM